MAEKLSIQIALDGGEEIRRQLAGIGEAGQKAFQDIAKAAEQAGGFSNLKPEEVTAKLKDMGIVGKDALDKISGAVASATRIERLAGVVEKIEGGFARLAQGALGFARVLGPIGVAAAAVGTKVVEAMNDAAKAFRSVEEAAAKAGISIEKFDRLRQSFEKGGISGTGIEAAIQKISEAAEKGKIAQVAKDLELLQEAAKRGFGGIGTAELSRLIETAQGIGPAADAARKALDKLGVSIPPAALQTLEQLAASAGTTKEALVAFIAQLEGIKDPAERNAVAFQQMGAAGLEIARAINTGAISSKQFAEGVATDAATITQSMANSANAAEQSSNRMSAAWERFKQTGDISQLGVAWDAFAQKVSTAVGDSIQLIGSLISKIGELASAVGGSIWDTFSSAGKAAIDAVVGAFDFLIGKIKEALGWLGKVFGGGGGAQPEAPGFASGGPVGGRGTGTSDSNLAWVSRGEHIMPANAARQPGVMAFLEALRRSGGDLGRVIDRMGRFALGGPVGMPALAGGSLGGMSNVTIQFPGMPDITGLRASSSVVDELRKAAAMAQVRSGGRKPSRYT
jgi:hypothetical protein